MLAIVLIAGLLSGPKVSASAAQVGAYPGTLKGPMTTATLQVVACPSQYGVEYQAGQGPSSVVGVHDRVSIPVRLVGKLSLYSDKYRSIEPLLAPSGWKCSASVGADGSGDLTAVPNGGSSSGEQLSYSFVPACTGCALDVYCPFISRAMVAAAHQGSCPMPSTKQSDEVVYQTPSLSEGTIFIEDPAGAFGSLTPYRKPQSATYVTAGYLSYRTLEPSSDLLSCTLPRSELDVCQTSWQTGFSDRELMKYSSGTTSTTSLFRTYSDTNAPFATFFVDKYRAFLAVLPTSPIVINVELSDSDPTWAGAMFVSEGHSNL
jgi:hypothetical protein